MKYSIIPSFKKCGLSVALDGSENDEVNIESLPEYQMPSAFVQNNEYVLDDGDESEKEDEDKGNADKGSPWVYFQGFTVYACFGV